MRAAPLKGARQGSVLSMLIPTAPYHRGDPSSFPTRMHTCTHTHSFALPTSARGKERPNPWAFPRNPQLAARTGAGIATGAT